MTKKRFLIIIATVIILLSLTTTIYAYISNVYLSNTVQVEHTSETPITVNLEILENGYLIPYNAIPTSENEFNELTLKITVRGEVNLIYKLIHNLPKEYELVGYQAWFPHILESENIHTFKLRLLEQLDGTTLNIVFEAVVDEIL